MRKENSQGPKWFTIREAAEYLAIGEPTLYRWMRDGKMTFRKIGDSTRFLKEDLDAFVQVFPSEKEMSQVKEICQACHHDKLVDGHFRTTGLNYFRPIRTKFWTLKDSNIGSQAKMCTRCGAIMLFGDVKKLNAIIDAKETEETPTFNIEL
jgi:excisionase family DNA binding protein